MKKLKILICDINIREQGHYVSYSQYLIDNIDPFLLSQNTNVAITFGFNLGGKHLLKYPESDNVAYHFFDVQSQASKSYNEIKSVWNTVKSFATENGFNEVIFMDLDQYQIPIGFSKHEFEVSGIYFRPHHRIATDKTDIRGNLKVKIKKFKKILLERVLLLNKKVKNIYILNDSTGVTVLNKVNSTYKFKYLADPIFSHVINKSEVDQQLIDLDSENIKFLIFGSISERKNVTNVVKAYALATFKQPTTLLIVGPSKETYNIYLSNLIKNQNLSTDKAIYVLRKFVTNSEMEYIHEKSNISLLLYKNFFGSSGLLGQAAKHKLYTIVPTIGLMSDLSTEYDLGIKANPEDIEEISRSLELSCDQYTAFSTKGLEKFYDDHKPVRFLEGLLGLN